MTETGGISTEELANGLLKSVEFFTSASIFNPQTSESNRIKKPPAEERRLKSKNLRYKKSIAAGLNINEINDELYEIGSECENARYAVDNDEVLIEACDGDEEEAYEFRMMFSDLSGDCERLQNILNDEYVTEYFDTFFSRIADSSVTLLGFDCYEDDYYALCGYDSCLAKTESQKKLMRLTKEEIISTASQCFGVISAFLSIRYRYDYLKSALDVLNKGNGAYLEAIKGIEEAYEDVQRYRDSYNSEAEKRFDKLISALPERIWIE